MAKNIFLKHPLNAPNGQPFAFEHAKNILAREKINSSGWELKNKDDAKLFEPKKIGKKDADRVNRNSGEVKAAPKKGNDNQSAESRGEVKAT